MYSVFSLYYCILTYFPTFHNSVNILKSNKLALFIIFLLQFVYNQIKLSISNEQEKFNLIAIVCILTGIDQKKLFLLVVSHVFDSPFDRNFQVTKKVGEWTINLCGA